MVLYMFGFELAPKPSAGAFHACTTDSRLNKIFFCEIFAAKCANQLKIAFSKKRQYVKLHPVRWRFMFFSARERRSFLRA